MPATLRYAMYTRPTTAESTRECLVTAVLCAAWHQDQAGVPVRMHSGVAAA